MIRKQSFVGFDYLLFTSKDYLSETTILIQ